MNIKCKICGKINFDVAADTQSACIKSQQFSPCVGDWVCLASVGDTVKRPRQVTIRKIVPDILEKIRPHAPTVHNCIAVFTHNSVRLELGYQNKAGIEEYIRVVLLDNYDLRSALYDRYVDGLQYKHFLTQPTGDTSYFKDQVMEGIERLLRDE